MGRFESWFIKSKNVDYDDYIWNIISSSLNSFQAVILLLVVTRGTNGISDSAIFVISYAIANLLMTIGKYGVRNFQVTDVKNQFSFREYLVLRKISLVAMLIGGMGYLIQGFFVRNYSLYKCIVMVSVIILRMFDSYEDVYHGQLQKQGKLFLASRVVAIRLLIYYILFLFSFFLTNNLAWTCIIAVGVSCCVGIILNKTALKTVNINKEEYTRNHVRNLFNMCFPLFACSFLLTFFSNAPKYIVDIYLPETEQALFNYIFMPVFVICLLGNFVFLPLLNKVALIWDKHEYKKFYWSMIRQILILCAITMATVVVCYFVGIPILELIFNVKLHEYKNAFLVLLVSGGLLAGVYLLNMFMTIIRCQKSMLFCFVMAAIATWAAESYSAKYYSIMEIVVSYCFILLFLSAVMFFIVTIMVITYGRKHKRRT